MQKRYPDLYSLPRSGWEKPDCEASVVENRKEALQGPAEAGSLSCTVWLF